MALTRVQTQLIKARMPRRQRGTRLRSSSERVCRSLLAAPVKRPRPVASSGSHNRGPPIISTAMGSSAVSSAGWRRGTPHTLSQTSARAWVLEDVEGEPEQRAVDDEAPIAHQHRLTQDDGNDRDVYWITHITVETGHHEIPGRRDGRRGAETLQRETRKCVNQPRHARENH